MWGSQLWEIAAVGLDSLLRVAVLPPRLRE